MPTLFFYDLYGAIVTNANLGPVHMSPIGETSRLPMISPSNSFTIKINIAFIWVSDPADLPVRSEIIGRRDENSPYEHASPVAGMKCSVLIGRQFTSGWFHLRSRDNISHMKPGHIFPREIDRISRQTIPYEHALSHHLYCSGCSLTSTDASQMENYFSISHFVIGVFIMFLLSIIIFIYSRQKRMRS